MSLLKVDHINTGYGKKPVLFDISLKVQKGETVVLIGSNGSGKSTLLKTIFGLLKPWDGLGRIWFEDEEITTFTPSTLIKKGIVYIPQQNELFEDLTVYENLELSGLLSSKNGQLYNKMEEVIGGIPPMRPLLKHRCSRLSGGERKFVSFGMALMNQPKLILLDEPLAGLSPKNVNDIISHIKILKDNGIALIIAEHRVKDIFELADTVIGLKLGSLLKESILSLDDMKKVII